MEVSILGYSGFVGTNLVKQLEKCYRVHAIDIRRHGVENVDFNTDVVINLIGKAHDVKNVIDPDIYYDTNTHLSNRLYDIFLRSPAKVYIHVSSVKAVSDGPVEELTEEYIPNPSTHYGKSKLLAEQYILEMPIPAGKRVYILRPSIIHGPNNKGNLNLLFNLVKKNIPWVLGAFSNRRSYCYIGNLSFIIIELIANQSIASGVYNISDSEPLSTNEVVSIISANLSKKSRVWYWRKSIIIGLSKIGDKVPIPINSERLEKLTQNYTVSNQKILKAVGKKLPFGTREGLNITFRSFK